MKYLSYFLTFTIACSPLYIIRSFFVVPIINLYVPVTWLEILILVSVAITGVVFLLSKYSISAFKTRFDVFILLFFLSACLAVYTSFDFIGGLGILKAYFIEPILFFYCLVFVSRTQGIRFILFGLLGAGIWLIGLSLFQKFFGIFIFAPVEYQQDRITAVYNSANSLALFLSPLAILVFSGFFKKKMILKYSSLILFAIFLLVIFYTRSRGGLFALTGAMSVFTYAVLTVKIKFLRRVWYVVPAVVLGGLILFFVVFYQNYNFFPIDYNKPYTQGDTLQIRYFIWAGTVNLLKDHFVSGAGLNGFKTLYSNQYRPIQYQEQFQYPHNILLTVWSELGIFGLFSFLLLVVTLYSVLIRQVTKSADPVFGAALIAVLSYWMLHGMVDVPYFKNDLSLEFWVVVALIEGWRTKEYI